MKVGDRVHLTQEALNANLSGYPVQFEGKILKIIEERPNYNGRENNLVKVQIPEDGETSISSYWLEPIDAPEFYEAEAKWLAFYDN